MELSAGEKNETEVEERVPNRGLVHKVVFEKTSIVGGGSESIPIISLS
jgi:hypothetical protein